MSISIQDQEILKNCFKLANNFIILTTGRAGSDFLQSCYDNHEEVASTSEKSTNLSPFIRQYTNLLPNSKEVFSALSIKELLFSFAPYINYLEKWDINRAEDYRKGNVKRYLNAMNFLLNINENDNSYLSITRIIIISFSYAINKNIRKIKTILIHLHHINKLTFYKDDLSSNDLVVLCNRSPYDLLASGVFHWKKYWFNSQQYSNCINLAKYRYVMSRSLDDYKEINKFLNHSKSFCFTSILEKLENLDYLNRINKYLKIEHFKEYPQSTVLGQKWVGDSLSTQKKTKFCGSYNASFVKRGNPIKRLGLIDATMMSIICKERIDFYEFNPNNKYLATLLSKNYLIRATIFSLLLLFPTKIEIEYFLNIHKTFFDIITCNKLLRQEKIKQLRNSILYVIIYPIEYMRIRFFRISSFIDHVQSPEFISELD